MFAVRRIIRSNVNLKNHIYTSGVLKCDKPKDTESIENKPGEEKTNIKKQPKVAGNDSKKKLTAEVNPKDYANFKSKKTEPKLKLYSNTTTDEEKLEAKKKLDSLTKEIENETVVEAGENEKFKNLVVPKPKKKVKNITEETMEESAKAVAKEFGGDVKKTKTDIMEYLKQWEMIAEKRKSKKEDGLPEQIENQGFRQFREGDRNSTRDRWRFEDRRNERVGYQERTRQDFRSGFRQDQSIREDKQDMEEGYKGREMGYGRREPRIAEVIARGRFAGVEPLGIFKLSDFKDEGPKLKIWDELEKLELEFLEKIPPRNYFEELIQWTEDGKLWHFPIDNDQGNDIEANVDFTEHVFLEEHLEPWCPKRGPLRHFMELVLVGLSKNPYITAEEKREHIFWYRDYFEEKKKLLQEMGALDGPKIAQGSLESNTKSENPV